MNKKKVLLTVLAMVLVCVMSVMGTLAYLAESTTPVTNTFVASGGEDDFVDTIEIKELTVTPNPDGTYTETNKEGDGNDYNVLPGITLPKHAFVRVERTSTAPAYLFIEVVGELNEVYDWAVDSTWTKLNVTGKNNGTVYVYGDANGTVLNAVENTYDILEDDQITVSPNASATQLGTTETTLTFYAYLAQATTGSSNDPATVYTACFLTASGN